MTESRFKEGIQVALGSIGVNAALALVKLGAAWWGHSYGMLADAAESSADVLTSIITLSGLKLSQVPADKNHPYGHGRAESLAAAAVSLILMIAALAIGARAIFGLGEDRPSPHPIILLVLAGVIVLKEILFRRFKDVGHELESRAVVTEAWHQRSDALVSLCAATGILISWVGGPAWKMADNYAAMVASSIIFITGIGLLRPVLHDLMDGAPSGKLIEQIRFSAAETAGVRGVEKIHARRMGMRLLVDLHVEVDGSMSVTEGHRIAHDVKEKLRRDFGAIEDVLVHVEPYPGT